MNEWMPIFAVRMGITRRDLVDLSALQMVDHVLCMIEQDRGVADGR